MRIKSLKVIKKLNEFNCHNVISDKRYQGLIDNIYFYKEKKNCIPKFLTKRIKYYNIFIFEKWNLIEIKKLLKLNGITNFKINRFRGIEIKMAKNLTLLLISEKMEDNKFLNSKLRKSYLIATYIYNMYKYPKNS